MSKHPNITIDELAQALLAIIGTKPDEYGYRAAANAMNDEIRAKARAALIEAGYLQDEEV